VLRATRRFYEPPRAAVSISRFRRAKYAEARTVTTAQARSPNVCLIAPAGSLR